jgi:polyhydroxyalkanoate synthase
MSASRPRSPAPAAAAAPRDALQALTDLNARFAARYQALWQSVQAALARPGTTVPEIATEAPGDRRFKAAAWREQPYFAWLRQAYLLYAEYVAAVTALTPLPEQERRRWQFALRHWLDAIAPSNFPATNPEVIARALETGGASLVAGLQNLAADAARGRITMTDESAFGVGRNIAVTPGSVVYRNDLIEVLQYAPTTPTVHRRPLLVVPPCINKYYILDLTPANSFVRHAVDQGHITFMISWRNIPPELGHLTWDDYLEQGVLAALRVASQVSGSATVNTVGFCVGGTILACALAVLAARGQRGVQSVTLLTTMLDFADPGEIGVYLSPEALAARAPALCGGARIQGSELANAFASLRANELVWNYVVNNYLKGRTPPAFDLLYWNADSAALPGPMYEYYIGEMYLANRLREPGALTMLGERVDLSAIDLPAYIYASREDHIVPWRSAYRSTQLLGGTPRFVLGASGHIAGVVNPPAPVKRNWWRNDALPRDPDAWLAGAVEVPGSWWPDWFEWIASHAGPRHKAPRAAGNARFRPIAPAPGTYVTEPST